MDLYPIDNGDNTDLDVFDNFYGRKTSVWALAGTLPKIGRPIEKIHRKERRAVYRPNVTRPLTIVSTHMKKLACMRYRNGPHTYIQ